MSTPQPSKEAMKAAKRVKLCSGCDMAGRQCDDCREYDEAHVWIAEALDAFAAKAVAAERGRAANHCDPDTWLRFPKSADARSALLIARKCILSGESHEVKNAG